MIFVDSNVFIYAVGWSHPLRTEAQTFFIDSRKKAQVLVTSAEVLQELLHVYLPVARMETLDAALELASAVMDRIIPIDSESVLYARQLSDQHPGLTARDLIHLSVCQIHRIDEIKTFDRTLQSAFRK
jgi:predicted nucleic acid-binding protein